MNHRNPSVKLLTVTALLMAMNVVMSSSYMSIPVPGGHIYINGAVIVTAGILLDPVHAAIVGGVGSFLGDLLFYPAPMFVSLVVHGIQGAVISMIAHRHASLKTEDVLPQPTLTRSFIAAAVGIVITVAGFTFGRAFVYSTPEYALLKLTSDIPQELVGAGIALFLVWKCGVLKIHNRFFAFRTTAGVSQEQAG